HYAQGHSPCLALTGPSMAPRIRSISIQPNYLRTQVRWRGRPAHAVFGTGETPAPPVLRKFLSDKHRRAFDRIVLEREQRFVRFRAARAGDLDCDVAGGAEAVDSQACAAP